jgi:soluble lytic murein transglycosylase-like protein
LLICFTTLTAIQIYCLTLILGDASKQQEGIIKELQIENGKLKKALFKKPKVIYRTMSVQQKIVNECNKQGVNPKLALAIAKKESGFKPKVNESSGATGVFQLMPVICNCYTKNCSNTDSNIRAGVAHIGALSKTFKSPILIAAAFNAGSPSVFRYNGVPPYPETQRYVSDVHKIMKEFD